MSDIFREIFIESTSSRDIETFFLKRRKRVLITIVSSNINEVTGAILNSFIQKFHNRKKQKTHKSKQK